VFDQVAESRDSTNCDFKMAAHWSREFSCRRLMHPQTLKAVNSARILNGRPIQPPCSFGLAVENTPSKSLQYTRTLIFPSVQSLSDSVHYHAPTKYDPWCPPAIEPCYPEVEYDQIPHNVLHSSRSGFSRPQNLYVFNHCSKWRKFGWFVEKVADTIFDNESHY
jgi:hypothetical protein